MIKGSIRIRTREEGDRFRPAGRGCGKTLKKLFCEAGVPLEQRTRVPVVCDDAGILLVAGFAPDERVAVTEQTQWVMWLRMPEEDERTDVGT